MFRPTVRSLRSIQSSEPLNSESSCPSTSRALEVSLRRRYTIISKPLQVWYVLCKLELRAQRGDNFQTPPPTSSHRGAAGHHSCSKLGSVLKREVICATNTYHPTSSHMSVSSPSATPTAIATSAPSPSKHTVLLILLPVLLSIAAAFGAFYFWIWWRVRKYKAPETGERKEMAQVGESGARESSLLEADTRSGADIITAMLQREERTHWSDDETVVGVAPPSYDPARPPGYSGQARGVYATGSSRTESTLQPEVWGSQWWHWDARIEVRESVRVTLR